VKALLIVVVLLLGLAVAADRVAVHVAEGQVATQIADKGGLHGKPTVQIGGFPFLTQALAGNYRDVHISLTAEEVGQPAGTAADVHLRGVKVPLSSVLSGSVTQVPVDSVDGTATLSYPLLAAQIGPDTTLSKEGDQLRITRTVELAGQRTKVTADGQVVLKGNDLVVDVQHASGLGVTLPSFLVERASNLLDLRYTVPALPFGLQLTSVTPEDDGVRVTVEGRQTVLHG
jgi:LmeA-like phospholipid-binding